mgnify:CR=1 FL=1
MTSFITTLFWLLVAHACTDVWWQDARMIANKQAGRGLDGFAWMLAHALINGAGVAIVTGSLWCGIGETVVHFVVDTLKCGHKIGLATDQASHLVSKLVWATYA